MTINTKVQMTKTMSKHLDEEPFLRFRRRLQYDK